VRGKGSTRGMVIHLVLFLALTGFRSQLLNCYASELTVDQTLGDQPPAHPRAKDSGWAKKLLPWVLRADWEQIATIWRVLGQRRMRLAPNMADGGVVVKI